MAVVTANRAVLAFTRAAALPQLHVNVGPGAPGQAQPELELAPAPGAPVPSAVNLADQQKVSTHTPTRVIASLLAIAVVVVALWLTYHNVADPTFGQGAAPATPVQGLTIFAVFFVAASAIERLLEPLSKMLPSTTDKKAEAESKVADAGQTLVAQAQGAPAAASATTLAEAAQTVDDSNYLDFWKSLLLWTVATIIAMIASAFLRLYFLRTVGISNGPRAVEILATGLIIGSGTKPLHDLITLISQANSSK